VAVPKQKTSKSRRDKRRSHLALTVNHAIEACTQCGEPKLMHRACGKCGYFRGRSVLPSAGA
jgi:large subunit ribosomal protein L32